MPTQLLVTAGPDKGHVFPLVVGGLLVIGRGTSTHTKLVDLHVSRVHCEVSWAGGKIVVKDNGSAGGTLVNGKQVAEAELKVGDVIRVGKTEFMLESDVAEETTLPPEAVPQATPAPGPAGPEVGFARKIGSRPLPPGLKKLQELEGQALGSYQLLKIIGTGQIGLVFQAKDSKDQKMVALKVLRPDFLSEAKAVQRFVRGMKTARSFVHPHLVTLHNAGLAKPYCWIAMEFIEGASVAELVKKGPGDWRQALGVAVHLARALAYLHGQGVIHRNISPPNILIQKGSQITKLGDAMLAKSLQGVQGQEVSSSGELVGNMFYMAPERTVGSGTSDGRADLYSLGASVYHLVTGRLPFQAGSLDELVTHIRQTQPTPPRQFQPALPEPLQAVLLRLLAKMPLDRYPSAGELLNDLTAIAKSNAMVV